MARNDTLTPKQLATIPHLLLARDVRQAAQLSGIPERTLHRWLSDERFAVALAEAEHAALDTVVRRLIAASDGAVAVVASILSDKTAANRDRLVAAKIIFDTVTKLRDLRLVEARLSALESTLYEIEQRPIDPD